MFFPDRRHCYKATCFALDPVRWLSFVLGPISSWMGFALCLRILFAPCGCRRAYCGPHCGRESARVVASLLGSSPSGVRHPISRLFLSLWPRRSRSPIPSLVPWWSPCPLMRWALLPLSGYVLSVPSAFSLHQSCLSIPFAMSPLSRRVFADGSSPLRAVALAEGRLPVRWVPSEPLGVSGGSTYIALHRSWLVSAILPYANWSSGRCFILFLRDVPHVFMAIILSV